MGNKIIEDVYIIVIIVYKDNILIMASMNDKYLKLWQSFCQDFLIKIKNIISFVNFEAAN